MAITCTIGVQLRRFKIHWKFMNILDTFSEDTKKQFKHFKGQTELITEEMQQKGSYRAYRMGVVEEDQVLLEIALGGYGGGSFTMSMEAQIPTHYNEGTSGSSHSTLDLMKVIMQELQLMRKDMKEMKEHY
ncbi:hypothetical protein M9H77_23369 [Catharanthus roseus]|uniref:Uncharacterized protein n=1 Tax=Catharanthus roseus TaxID=4058 RepID=A0ACC0ATI5_CATRO|nr:hypothetical protein M9H77_23369 [Catharanthus roseus]